jgi:hypothetical protein
VLGADDHGVAEALRDELDAAKDEHAHQDVAEVGIALHQRLDVRVIELDDLAVLVDANLHDRAPVRVNCPARKVATMVSPLLPAGRTMRSWPLRTTKNGACRCPSLTSTSSRRTARVRPRLAIRSRCEAVSVGKT